MNDGGLLMQTQDPILVVDDDADLRELLARVLTKAGFIVDTVTNGEEAVRALEAMSFSAVVTDILMPTKEGLETIIEIKRRWPKCKIVALSGGGRFASGDVLDLAQKFGADAVLRKPVGAGDLVATLDRVLGAGAGRRLRTG